MHFISQGNSENSCGCREQLQAIERDVAEMKAAITSGKATSELKNKFKCTIDQKLVGTAAYRRRQTFRVYSFFFLREMTSWLPS